MNPQQVSLDNFTMLCVIGKGSYAKVLLVRKKGEDNQLYAMKILKKKYIEKRKQENNVMIERNILVGLDHPFLIKLHYSFQNEKKLFFALEYCPGGELFGLLSKKQRFSEEQAKFYAAQIILALEYLHNKDIVYRDLKPQNVLLDEKGFIRLTDFGLSKINMPTDSAFSVCGTPEYLAPEVLYKQGHGKPVDWWCLGSVIYEMVVGLPPFYAKNRSELFDKIKFSNPNTPTYLSVKIRNLFDGLFQKRPENRLGTKNGAIDIKKHPWFQNIKWEQILGKKVKPPFVPSIKSSDDVSNFDSEFTECDIESLGSCSPRNTSTKEMEKDAYHGFEWNKSAEDKMDLEEHVETNFEMAIEETEK